jgi:hypothetical protein
LVGLRLLPHPVPRTGRCGWANPMRKRMTSSTATNFPARRSSGAVSPWIPHGRSVCGDKPVLEALRSSTDNLKTKPGLRRNAVHLRFTKKAALRSLGAAFSFFCDPTSLRTAKPATVSRRPLPAVRHVWGRGPLARSSGRSTFLSPAGLIWNRWLRPLYSL